ncbi:MAG: hypothetical protein ACXVAN_19310 [Polyangia bacterium]
MAHIGSMLGLWIVRDAAGQALLAKVQHEVYVLAFGSAIKASRARDAFGAAGSPFLIVAANLRDVVDEARLAGARGFIVDYDVALSRFASAHPLPAPPAIPAAAAR